MEWYAAGGLLVGTVVLLMALSVPVAFAFLATNVLGVMLFMGGAVGLSQLVANAATSISTFTLAPIPLFLVMGELFFHTGLAVRVFDALDKCFGRLPGRLSYLTVGGGTIFAALSGSSMANTAMLGSLMIPEMMNRGYKKHMAMGPILGVGGLAVIIPPSALAVLLGSLARINIGDLLMAGLVPGVILGSLYAILIYTQLRLDPEAAPRYAVARQGWVAAAKAVVINVLPMGLVVFCVVGLIILGIATPTEAAAFGALSVVILAVIFRCFTLKAMKKSLVGTLKVSAMTFFIIIGSSTFSQLLAFSGASSGLINWVTDIDLTPNLALLIMFGVLLVLGMFMDQVSMMMLTLPIFIPLAQSMHFDLVWFGIIVLLALEISFTTPPFGLLLFVMMGVAPKGTTLPEVALSALPFIGCALLLVAILVLFPEVALWLPSITH